MDCVEIQALIGVETCRLLSISGYSLQGWAGRRKRLTTTSEFSIPGRACLGLSITLEANPLVLPNDYTRFGSRWGNGKKHMVFRCLSHICCATICNKNGFSA